MAVCRTESCSSQRRFTVNSVSRCSFSEFPGTKADIYRALNEEAGKLPLFIGEDFPA